MLYNILDYGAVADNHTVNTRAINAAIDACASSGGGTVVIPAGGAFVSGTIWLKSHVELHLEQGAVLKASPDFSDYCSNDAYPQNGHSDNEMWTGGHLIVCLEQTDVAITGNGKIDGNVWAFINEGNKVHNKWVDENNLYCWFEGFSCALRPGQTIAFIECTDIRVENITLRDLPSWGVFVHGCEHIQIRGIKVYNRPDVANTDGIDIDCCRYVTVSDCIIDTGDDAIAIRNSFGRLKQKDKITEFITITNCVLASCSSVFRIGVGQGEIRHIRVSNITVNRGSTLTNFCTEYSASSHTPISDVNFSNISATNISNAFIILTYTGVSVKNITLENFRVEARAASTIINHSADTSVFNDITLRNYDIILIDDQPVIDEDVLRQRGNYVIELKNASGIRLENLRVFASEQLRSKWSAVLSVSGCPDLETVNCKL